MENNKKRIGIITYYNVHNHGAFLQSYALKTILEKQFNCDVNFLSFQRDYRYISKSESSKYKLSIKSFWFYLKYLLKKGISNILFNVNKRIIFKKFQNNNFRIYNNVFSYDGEIIVIGSDEVFALDVGYNSFMYGNDLKPNKIISYAGSFGATLFNNIKEINMCDQIKNGFEKMAFISVRDQNSYDIVTKLGFSPYLVCDPVFLYGYKNEMILSRKMKNKNNKEYLLIYSYDKNMNSPNEVSSIKEFALKNNLQILSVGFFHKWADKNINCNPIELLSWFMNAKYVITDTFHGSVLSIIAHKEFAVIIRNESPKLAFLLSQYNLENRIVNKDNDFNSIFKDTIDYALVEKEISENRTISMNFLKKCIN